MPAARVRPGAVFRRRPSRRRRPGRGGSGWPVGACLAPGARHAAGPLGLIVIVTPANPGDVKRIVVVSRIRMPAISASRNLWRRRTLLPRPWGFALPDSQALCRNCGPILVNCSFRKWVFCVVSIKIRRICRPHADGGHGHESAAQRMDPEPRGFCRMHLLELHAGSRSRNTRCDRIPTGL